MSVVLIEQQVVHYEVLGRGRPLIFLHGWVGSWRYWVPVMQAVSANYRAYALDLWGFGDTAKSQVRYSLNNQIRLVDGFLYEMGIGRVVLVGHGLGAAIAVLYALRNPGVVDRVMAVSCPMDEARVSARLRSASPTELADWLMGKSEFTEPVRTDAPKTDPQALTASITDISASEIKEAYFRLSTPCLFVDGLYDPAVAPPDQDGPLQQMYNIHSMIFEQSGHFPMLDESAKFNRLLIDFLSLASGESPRQLQMKEEWKRRVR